MNSERRYFKRALTRAFVCVITAAAMVFCAVSCSAADADGASTAAALGGARMAAATDTTVRADSPSTGDVNGDGAINARDVTALMRFIVGFPDTGIDRESADLNKDGRINSRDVIALMKSIISGTSPGESAKKTLVLYFSATGTTKGVAGRIAQTAGADLREIVPAVPYTADDLKYSDRSTRATAEQDDPNARPGIAGDISLDGYTTVYLGYPIWWGQAPRIMSTFVEAHDFTGITVIPFCTSGSSDIGTSDDTLAEQAGSGNWLQGRRFSAGVSDETLREWIEETGGANVEKTLHLAINGVAVEVAWEDNDSVSELAKLVSSSPLTVEMSMYGGFEQVGSLGTTLPRSDVQTTTEAGDIVLYSGDQLVIFYGSNSWAYTRLGRITDKSADEMAALLGSGNVTVILSLG